MVNNSGLIWAYSQTGMAIGLNAGVGSDSLGGRTFYNTGTISAQGAVGQHDPFIAWPGAIGVLFRLGGNIVNDGEILAGIVPGADPSQRAYGVWVSQTPREWPVGAFTNNGTIAADVAIKFDGGGTQAFTLTNNGTLSGDVLFYGNNDTYDNTNGTTVGMVYGMGGNDTLTGGAKPDWFEGGAGDDVMDGKADYDGASYATAAAAISVDLQLSGAQNTGGAGYDTLRNIENLIGSSFSDTLIGNSLANHLEGLAGNDRLDGGDGGDTMIGGAGNDVISGGAGSDTLTGGTGLDIFLDTAAGLNGDTIADLSAGDRIRFTDAALSSFAYSLSGSTLVFTGGSLALPNLPVGLQLSVAAAASGGVELTLGARDVLNDFNGDGRSDMLWRNDNGLVTDWLGQANGSFGFNDGNAWFAVPDSWHVNGTGDFNGDGRDDILWRNDSGVVTDWLGQANGSFAFNDANFFLDIPNSWHIAGTGDFNGDGRDDILWRDDSGVVTDWLGQANGSFAFNDANFLLAIPNSWHIAGTGDFNGDGRDDILWRDDSGVVTDWLGQANGSFAFNDANILLAIPNSWHIAGTGDFNGDGRDDILWRDDSGVVTDWLGQANGSFAFNDANFLLAIPNSWNINGTGDFNGDGHDDIAWRNDSGVVTDWLGQANGAFAFNDANFLLAIPNSWHIPTPDTLVVA